VEYGWVGVVCSGMALRVLVVMMLLMSPVSGLSSAIAAACGGGERGSVQLVEMVDSCPLCALSEQPMYCGCGCGEFEQTPIPDTGDVTPMVITLVESVEFDEVEITAIVAAIEAGDDCGRFVELVEDDRLDRSGGIHSFLAMTGHWII
jgi:hypothetical protein